MNALVPERDFAAACRGAPSAALVSLRDFAADGRGPSSALVPLRDFDEDRGASATALRRCASASEVSLNAAAIDSVGRDTCRDKCPAGASRRFTSFASDCRCTRPLAGSKVDDVTVPRRSSELARDRNGRSAVATGLYGVLDVTRPGGDACRTLS